VGIVDKNAALDMAEEAGLDLVEVSPNSSPPVCRIMDYGKWLYEQRRKHKKSHQPTSALKEIRLKPETNKHDLDIKVRHAHEFLEKGHRVQFTMLFRGRQLLHLETGYQTFDRIIADLEDVAKVDRPSHLTNRRMTLLLVPKK
jgi:translation initiation factor IF-3